MKKILLTVIFILAIFQMVVLATAIDVGSAAIDRDSTASYGYTRVDQANPANATGQITSVDIWAASDMSNCEIGIFYVVSGTNLSTRDNETIGAVASGSKQTFAVTINVTSGDYIGWYATGGTIERRDTGGSGVWAVSGDQMPCTNVTFSNYLADSISLYATGATPAATTTNIFMGVNF